MEVCDNARAMMTTIRMAALRLGVAAAALTMALPDPASALGLELEARYWDISFDGTVRPLEERFGGSIDLVRDLGFESDSAFEGRFTFRPGLGLFVRASYLTLSANAEKRFGIDLEEIPIGIDARVKGDLDFDYGRLALGWQFTAPGRLVRLGPYVEAKGLQGSAMLGVHLPSLEESLTEDFEAVFGAVGAIVELQPTEKIQIFADTSLLLGEDDADWSDTEVGLRYFPISVIGLGAGYRRVEIDGEIDRVALDIEYDGFFITILLRI